LFSHMFTSVSDSERAFAFYAGVLGVLELELRFHEPLKPWAGWHSPPERSPGEEIDHGGRRSELV
jgi:hypothetical protein